MEEQEAFDEFWAESLKEDQESMEYAHAIFHSLRPDIVGDLAQQLNNIPAAERAWYADVLMFGSKPDHLDQL